MHSVRLDPELEVKLEKATSLTGQSASEIIRDAVHRRCSDLLGQSLERRLSDVVGSVKAGGDSRKSGRAFTKVIRRKRARRR